MGDEAPRESGEDGANVVIDRLQKADDPAEVENRLDALRRLVSTPQELAPGVAEECPAVIVSVTRRFPDTPLVFKKAMFVILSLTGSRVQGPSSATRFAFAAANAGIVEVCIDNIRREETSISVAQCCCRVLSNIAERGSQFGRPEKIQSVARAALFAMRRYPDAAKLQADAQGILLNLTNGPPDHTTSLFIKKCGGIEMVIAAMRRHPTDSNVQHTGCGTLSNLNFCLECGIAIHGLQCIELVVESMRSHRRTPLVQVAGCHFLLSISCVQNYTIPTDLISSGCVEHLLDLMRDKEYAINDGLMTKACEVLGKISSLPNTKNHMYDAGVIPLVMEAMTNHKDSETVQEDAIGVLWNFSKTEEYRVVISEEFDGVSAIVKAMEKHRHVFPVQREAAGALYSLSMSKDPRIRKKLTTSNAIPALFSLFQEHYDFRAMLGGQYDLERLQFVEAIADTLYRLGVMDTAVFGDVDSIFDPDNEVDTYPIESPPFDVRDLLDKDLTKDAPGWYRERGFVVDNKQSISHEEECDREFLYLSKQPVIDQEVCLRIALPFGGRGYMYGRITEIGATPTEEELEHSDSNLSGNGRLLANSTGSLESDTRDECLAASGALNGQQVTATLSLESDREFRNRKRRFEPLPEFFRGETSSYVMVIRFMEEERKWKVVRIHTLEQE